MLGSLKIVYLVDTDAVIMAWSGSFRNEMGVSIEQDHDPATAVSLQAELRRFDGKCWYDPGRKKIVYRTDEEALHAYLELQREEMDRHKWIESEHANRDLRDAALADWVQNHSMTFSADWHRTHVFVLPNRRGGGPGSSGAGNSSPLAY